MYRNPQLPSLQRRIGTSLVIGMFMAFIGAAVEASIDKHPLWSFESLDDVIIGVMAAGVVFMYEQRRCRAILEKIQVISAMNHHVRNALQTISYAPYTEQEKQIKLIAESVSRIEWALREILPGESDPAHALHPGSPEERSTQEGSAEAGSSQVGSAQSGATQSVSA